MLGTSARSVLIALVGLSFLAFVAAPAGSAAHSCARPGLDVIARTATNVVLEQVDVGGAYEGDSITTFVCSLRYGKIVLVGGRETTGDGDVWGDVKAMNMRFVAVAHGNGGNADGGEDEYIDVTDLKTGKLWTRSPTGGPRGYGGDVLKAVLDSSGALAWTHIRTEYDKDYEPVGDATVVLVRYPTGKKKAVQLAIGKSIEPQFLRWSNDEKRVVWADRLEAVKFTRQKFKAAKPRKGGSCTRAGDRIIDNSPYGWVVVSRAFSAPGWTNGRKLIACSNELRRRVTIARTGRHGETTFVFRRYAFDSEEVQFAAAVVSQETEGHRRTVVQSYDLSRGKRLCRQLVAGNSGPQTVGAIELNGTGSMAWTTVGSDPDERSVRMCDNGRSRTVFAGPKLEPSYLSFSYWNKLHFITEVKTG